MLIEPAPALLLRRVCDALEASPGDARQQRAAIWLLRDLSRSIAGRAEAIAADIADMCAVLGDAAAGDVVHAAGDAARLHVALQARLEEVARDRSLHARLRALHLGMLRRERELLGPPGGNPSLERRAPTAP